MAEETTSGGEATAATAIGPLQRNYKEDAR